jgi:hypothetical protein
LHEADPFVVWKVENPGGDQSVLRISEYREDTGKRAVEYAWDGDLTMARRNGLRIASEHEEEPEESEDDRIFVKTVADGQESVSSKIRRTWRQFEWGEELVEKVVDPNGAAMKTVIEYLVSERKLPEMLYSMCSPNSTRPNIFTIR